jgi:hypothetical protein
MLFITNRKFIYNYRCQIPINLNSYFLLKVIGKKDLGAINRGDRGGKYKMIKNKKSQPLA